MGALLKRFQKLIDLPEFVFVRQAKAGDKDAFGNLYNMYIDKIYRYIFFRVGQKRELAEDVTSDVFTKAWENLESFSEGSFQAWLYTIARNKVIDHYRLNNRYTSLDESLPSGEESIEENVFRSLEIENVFSAMEKLTPEQKEVLILKFVEDLENKEIAQILKKNEDAVRALQYRALKDLRKALT